MIWALQNQNYETNKILPTQTEPITLILWPEPLPALAGEGAQAVQADPLVLAPVIQAVVNVLRTKLALSTGRVKNVNIYAYIHICI